MFNDGSEIILLSFESVNPNILGKSVPSTRAMFFMQSL